MRCSVLMACVFGWLLCSCAAPRAILPEAPREWWVHVWVGTPHSVFWVQLDETGAGKYWAKSDGQESVEGEMRTSPEASRRIYDSVLRLFRRYSITDVPMLSVDQIQEMMEKKPIYHVSFTVRVGQQQLSFDTPLLESLDEYTGLRPVVAECAALLGDRLRNEIGLEPLARPNR